MEKSGKISCIFALCVVLVFGSIASATPIDNIVITSFPITKWFDGLESPVFQFTDMSGGAIDMQSCDLSKVGTPNLDDYKIEGTVHVSPSSLITDQTALSGGWAKGVFAGESTLTIFGSLYQKIEGNFVLIPEAENVLLLEADMYGENWEVIEDNSIPTVENNIFGQAYFDTSSGTGLLNTGTLGLTIGNFKADFSFEGEAMIGGGGVTNFSVFDAYTATYPTAKIQISAIPEPITVCLLAFGSILVTRKRR